MKGVALLSRVSGVALTLALAAPAVAQDNAVATAADAFGERAGIEQSGLYSESQVRGFDLNDSGAYRIDEAYFSRGGALDDTVLAGVSVRVGVNAARLPFPAPSGTAPCGACRRERKERPRPTAWWSAGTSPPATGCGRSGRSTTGNMTATSR